MDAEVVIIGAGIIGMSVALQLARAGCHGVVVLERHQIGSGSSGRGVGGFRQQFETEINVRLSQLSLPILQALGDQIELRQHGYLYLALSPDSLQRITRRAERQRAWGVPVELLDRAELRRRWPFLSTDDLLGAAFCALDGYARPPLALAAYARTAQALGVQVREGVAATALVCEPYGAGTRITAVETIQGRLTTRRLVNAAGPWAAAVAAMAGVDLPVRPLKRQVFLTTPCPDVPRHAPLTIDQDTGFHFRPDGPALLLAMSGGEQPGVEDFTLDPELGQTMLTHARRRLPALADAGLVSGRAGLYELTPDAHPILGPVPGVAGLLLACGFSGHGFMHSAAAGLLLAEQLIGGQAVSLDISSLSITRFAAGRLLGPGLTL